MALGIVTDVTNMELTITVVGIRTGDVMCALPSMVQIHNV